MPKMQIGRPSHVISVGLGWKMIDGPKQLAIILMHMHMHLRMHMQGQVCFAVNHSTAILQLLAWPYKH